MSDKPRRKNSRAKGARCEREAASYLTALGFSARRGQQFRGGPFSPDVIVDDLPNVHIECKAVEGMDLGTKLLESAWEQAWRDASDDKVPVVLWKRNRTCWRLT